MTILDTVTTQTGKATEAAIAVDDQYAAHNYSPLPIVAGSGSPARVLALVER